MLFNMRDAWFLGELMMNNQFRTSNRQIFENFISPALYVYFQVKRPDIEAGELRIRLTELLKFLILSHEFPGNILFGEDLDDLWHLWIMQTREYETLCRALPGGRFIHHDSRDQPTRPLTWSEVETVAATMIEEKKAKGAARAGADLSPEKLQQGAERLLSFFASYIENFGEIQPKVVHCWPSLERLLRRMRWSLDELNAFLIEHATATVPAVSRRDALPA